MFGRHFFAYEFARQFISPDHTVLEAGSGDGYGSSYLSDACSMVIGIDIEWEAVWSANETYKKSNLSFLQASVFELPLESGSVDFVCSMQVIEHLADPLPYLEELKRIMTPNAYLVITTPFRETKGWRFDRIPSPFHVIEYTGDELQSLLNSVFSDVDIRGIAFKDNSEAGKTDVQLGRFQTLDVFGFRKLIPSTLKPFIYRILRFKPIGEINMSSHDFELVDSITPEVLDLIAICRA